MHINRNYYDLCKTNKKDEKQGKEEGDMDNKETMTR